MYKLVSPSLSAIFLSKLPTGYATSEPKGGESLEKLAKTAEKWLPERKLSRRQMLEGVEARGLIWYSHTSLGEGSVLQNPL